MSLRAKFIAFDDALARCGVPPLTAWWREGIGKWLDAYELRSVLELFACAGRGSAKSTALYKLALFFTLFGAFEVPPGEIHFAIVLSRLKEEAAKGVDIIDRWLDLLAIKHRRVGDVIELADMPRGVRVVAASVAGSSGWRAYFVGKDERSKWPDSDLEERDAEEIDTSASAMTATHALAPCVTVGSAWVDAGSFHEAISAGSNEHRVVLGPAPTWIAAPHITEASCHRKEPDPSRFNREYASIASSGSSDALNPDDVAAAVRPLDPEAKPCGRTVLLIDSSSGRGDGFSFATARFFQEKGRRLLVVQNLDAFEGDFANQGITFETVVSHIAGVAKAANARLIYGDQYLQYALESAFRTPHGLNFMSRAWDQSSKVEALSALRRLFQERTLVIDRDGRGQADAARRELASLKEVILPSKVLSVAARRYKGHADRASLILLLARLVAKGELDSRLATDDTRPRREVTPGPWKTGFDLSDFGGFQKW